MDLLLEGRAQLVFVGKGKFKIIRPAGVAGDEQRLHPHLFQLGFQDGQGLHRQLVVFRQGGNEAVSAVGPKPEGVAGEQVLVVNEIDHVAPGVSGDQEALDFNILDAEGLPVF